MFRNFTMVTLSALVGGVILPNSTSADIIQSEPQQVKLQCEEAGICVLPEPLQNGKFRPSENRCRPGDTSPACLMLPKAFVPKDWVLKHSCERGYVLNASNTVSVCYKSRWAPALPVCNKLCPPLRSPGVDVTCTFGGTKVSCDLPMRPGTVATQKCKEHYHLAYDPESPQLTCLDIGLWTSPLSFCTPDEVCKENGLGVWTCKKISQCKSAKVNLRKGVRPETCYFEATEPYICCEPESNVSPRPSSPPTRPPRPRPTTTQRNERTSTRMCREYAESVYVKAHEANGGEYRKDTCVVGLPSQVIEDVDDTPQFSSNAQPREFPHMAIIGFGNKTNRETGLGLCFGVLISERYVLTVAHCSIRKPLWVRLGDYNALSTEDEKDNDARSQTYDIIKIIDHPGYNEMKIPLDDISLYKLDRDVVFNEYIRPICLPSEDYSTNPGFIQSSWGPVVFGERPSPILQKIDMVTVDGVKCNDAYKSEDIKINDKAIVCATRFDGYDTCQGTSGSPLQVRLRKPYCMFSLVGLSSFGRGCTTRTPGAYTKVSNYLSWIESNVWDS